MATYKKHIAQKLMCADCVGLIKSFFWTSGGTTENKYATNGCPDTNANGMIKLCNQTGPIATVPDIPGLILWSDGHVGVTIGGGYAIEARGFNYGIVKTKIKDRGWKKWGKLKLLTYVADAEPGAPMQPEEKPADGASNPHPEPTKNLKKGAKGSGVKWVQWMLNACGYDIGRWGIDGDFGNATDSAVRKFQKGSALKADGIVGPLTRQAMKAAHGRKREPSVVGDEKEEPEPDPDDVEAGYQAKGKIADLSKWQGQIDWGKAATELDFCVLRAQYGHEKRDERYLEYAAGCGANGIPFGAYSFCLFKDVSSAREEARLFVERTKGTRPLYLVLDLEPGGVKVRDIRREVSAYIGELRALGVQRIGLYIAHHAFKAYNIDVSEADFIWVPRYGTNSGKPETPPAHRCDLWQFTSMGRLAGVSGRVDLNKLMDDSRMNWFRGKE